MHISTEKHTEYLYDNTHCSATLALRWYCRGAAVAMVQRQRYDWLLKAWTKTK